MQQIHYIPLNMHMISMCFVVMLSVRCGFTYSSYPYSSKLFHWHCIIVSENSSSICDKSRKAIFGLQKKVTFSKILPPKIRFEMFDTMTKPILTNSSDVWGINKNALREQDRVFLNYVRCVLCVKLTTSNVVVIGESDNFPPSLFCHINVLCSFHGLLKMQPGKTVKSVFDTLYNLNNQGFQTWNSKAHDLAIERGRYVRPKLNVGERLCLSCNVVENEEHFVTACKDNEVERALFTNWKKETHHLPI